MSSKIRLIGSQIAYILNVLILVTSIIIACYVTTELASRISAKSFVELKINEIQASISENSRDNSPTVIYNKNSDGPINSASSSFIDSSVDLNNERVILSKLRALQESLVALDFAGAQTSSKTVHSIVSTYESAALESEYKNQLDVLSVEKRRRQDLIKEIYYEETQIKLISQKIKSNSPNLDINQEIDKIISDDLVRESTKRSLSSLVSGIGQVNSSQPSNPTFEFVDPPLLDLIISLSLERDSVNESISQIEKDTSLLVEKMNSIQTIPLWATNLYFVYFLSYLPSDILLSVLMISCGVLGSLFVGLREGAPAPMLRAPIGAAAGFISFLIVKGGKFLFLVQAVGSDISINPFASAFAGIVAGLFTERAYRVLERVFDRLSDNFLDSSSDKQKGKSAKTVTTVPEPQVDPNAKSNTNAFPSAA